VKRAKVMSATRTTESDVAVLDATLRDGSYAVNFQFDPAFVADLLSGIDATGLRFIELGHGVGVEAEQAGYPPCNIELPEWCRIANEKLASTPWGVFAQPSFTRLSTLEWMSREGMSFVRVGMEAHRVEANLAYLEAALAACGTVYLNLMKTSVTPLSRLPDLIRDVPREVAGVYVVDSFGSMLPSDVQAYVETLRQDFAVVGFHGHDNLGLANANSLSAIAAGARIVDGTLCGIGRGSGNAMTEALAGILTRNHRTDHDFRTLARMAEFCRRSLNISTNDRYLQVLGGVIGVHTSLFPVIERVCAEFMVDAVALMEHATARSTHDVQERDLIAAAQELAHTTSSLTNKPDNTMVNA